MSAGGRASTFRPVEPKEREHVRGGRSWWKTAVVLAGVGAVVYLLWPSGDRHAELSSPPSPPPGSLPGGAVGANGEPVSHGSAHVAITVR